MTAEEEAKADTEETAEEKPAAGPPVWEGCAAGKYQWDENRKAVDLDMGDAITKYSWSDGKKQVSIYIELEGLDDLAEDAFVVDSGEKECSLVIAMSDSKKKRFALSSLSEEIDGVKLVRKKGKNTVVLKLQKKEEKSWFQLVEKSGGRGGDDEGGPGGPGGMGG